MNNFDKYRDAVLEHISKHGDIPALVNGEFKRCRSSVCDSCDLDYGKDCGANFILWLYSECEDGEIVIPTRRKVGKWKWSLADNGWTDYTCTECGHVLNMDNHCYPYHRYCPVCGAYMWSSGEPEHVRYLEDRIEVPD